MARPPSSRPGRHQKEQGTTERGTDWVALICKYATLMPAYETATGLTSERIADRTRRPAPDLTDDQGQTSPTTRTTPHTTMP